MMVLSLCNKTQCGDVTIAIGHYIDGPHQPTDPGDSRLINWRPPNSQTFAVFHRHTPPLDGRATEIRSTISHCVRSVQCNPRAFRNFSFRAYDLSSCADVRSSRFTMSRPGADSENALRFLPADSYGYAFAVCAVYRQIEYTEPVKRFCWH